MSVPAGVPASPAHLSPYDPNLAWVICDRYSELYPGQFLPWNWQQLYLDGDLDILHKVAEVIYSFGL
jgi:hypothetical protein